MLEKFKNSKLGKSIKNKIENTDTIKQYRKECETDPELAAEHLKENITSKLKKFDSAFNPDKMFSNEKSIKDIFTIKGPRG